MRGNRSRLRFRPSSSVFDVETGLSTYSQTEFDVKDAVGAPQGTIKFSGTGGERMMEVFDAAGSIKSTTTLAATGAITVRPISGASITVGYLPATTANQDGTVTTIVKDAQGDILSSRITQTFDDGTAIATTTYPSGASRTLIINSDCGLYQQSQTAVDIHGNTDTVVTSGTGQLVSQTHTEYSYDENGVSRVETVLSAEGVVSQRLRH